MIHLGSNVMFLREHYGILFAPTYGDWDYGREVQPAVSFDDQCYLNLPKDYRGGVWKRTHVQNHVGMIVEQIVGQQIPYIQRRADYEWGRKTWKTNDYEFFWGSLINTFVYNPKKNDPVPPYLQQFRIEGYKVREAVENANGCTYYAVTEDNKLWEIDRE